MAIHCVVAAMAAARGVTLKETHVEVQATTDRTLEFRIACEVRAMIVSATIVVRGRAVIGDDLCARFEELAVEGDGMVASLAKAAIEPRLTALCERPFPIADLKLPGLVVSGVTIVAGETVRLTVTLAASN